MFNWLKNLQFGYKPADYSVYLPTKNTWNCTPKISYDVDILSLGSKQSLLYMVKGEINHLQKYSFLLSNTSAELYKMADKGNPETLDYFDKLNNVRDENRKTKKRIKQLARIAKELKMSMK